MLKERVFTGLALFILAALSLFELPSIGFVAVSWLMCLVGIHELSQMYKFDRINQFGLMFILTLLALLLYVSRYDPGQIVMIVAMLTWCFIVPFILVTQPKHFSVLIVAILAAIIFVPAFYALVKLYELLGPWRLISIMAIAWVSDTGAYFIGRKFGRRKLAPKISPGKSIEGALGGLFFVIIYLLILKNVGQTVFLYSYVAVFKFALILTTAGIVGDLFESWLKRVAGVKDSGKILPGHGGVFDRIDSLLAILAVSFAMIWGMI
jgi:phosphatidate cytidylyltransferase